MTSLILKQVCMNLSLYSHCLCPYTISTMHGLQFRKSVQSIKPYIPGKSIEEVVKELGVQDVIKMASNENPFGCPVSAEELAPYIQRGSYYPNVSTTPLYTQVADIHGVSEKQVVFGNGSDELLMMLGQVFLSPETHAIFSQHTFSEYEFVCRVMGSSFTSVPTRDHAYDLQAILYAIRAETRVIFLANPNNPTGLLVPRQTLSAFLEVVPDWVAVVLDEAYAEFVTSHDFATGVSFLEKHPNVIVTRTFSKLYGLAAFRIGYAVATETVIAQLHKVRQPFNVNQIAAMAAVLALDKKAFIQRTLENNEMGKRYLYSIFEKLGLDYIPTEANFICVQLPFSGKLAFESLLKLGIIVRNLASFELPNAIRITIGLTAQNERLGTALKSLLSRG